MAWPPAPLRTDLTPLSKQVGHSALHNAVSDAINTVVTKLATIANTTRSATLTVAASNASAAEKAVADYVCDGVDDQVEINAAIAALPSGYRGRVQLSEGQFVLSDAVVCDRDGVTLAGQGRGATVFSADQTKTINRTNSGMIVFGVTATRNSCHLRDLALDLRVGGVSNTFTVGTGSGVVFGASSSTIERVNVSGAEQDGFLIQPAGLNAQIFDTVLSNCYVYNPGRDAYSVDSQVLNSEILLCKAQGGQVDSATSAGQGIIANPKSRYGFYIRGADYKLIACHAFWFVNGVQVDNQDGRFSKAIVIIGGEYENNAKAAIIMTGAKDSIITGALLYGNNRDGSNNTSAITITFCSNVQIAHNSFRWPNINCSHIWVSSTPFASVVGNILLGGAYSICTVGSGSDGTIVAHNLFVAGDVSAGTATKSINLASATGVTVSDNVLQRSIVETGTADGNRIVRNRFQQISPTPVTGPAAIVKIGASTVTAGDNVYRGAWASTAIYEPGDLAVRNGTVYTSLSSNNTADPAFDAGSNWKAFADAPAFGIADVTGTPVYVWHRGGALVAPESTLEAFENAINLGAQAIKFDAMPLADGSLGVIHDSTVDRTTTSTGNVASLNGLAFKNLTIKSTALAGPGFVLTQRPPLLTEAIERIKGRAHMMIEWKGAAQNIATLTTLLSKLKLQRNVTVVIQDIGGSTTTILTAVTAIKAAGFRCLYLYNGATLVQSPIANVIAAGATDVGVGYSYTDANITSIVTACQAASVRVHGFTLNTRYERDRMTGLGITWVHSDDPQYLSATAPLVTSPSFTAGIVQSGLILSPNLEAPAPFAGAAGSARIALPANLGGVPGGSAATVNVQMLLGQICPSTAATRTINVPFVVDALEGDATRWLGIHFCGTDDYYYNGTATAGYLLLYRLNGSLELYKYTPGATANGVPATGSQLSGPTASATATTVAGTAVTLTVAVTPTSVTGSATVGGTTTSLAAYVDATYRGGYLRIVKASGGAGLAVSVTSAGLTA